MKIIDSDMQKQFMNDGFYVFRNMLEPEADRYVEGNHG